MRILVPNLRKRVEAPAHRGRKALRHSVGQDCPRSQPGGPDGAAQHVGGRGQDELVAKPSARPALERAGSVEPQRLTFEEPGEFICRVGADIRSHAAENVG